MATQLIDRILAAAFAPETFRTPRSPEYKTGTRAALMFRLAGTHVECPYTIGTAKADAWFSGIEEGHRLWRDLPESSLAMPDVADELPPPMAAPVLTRTQVQESWES